MRFRLYLGERSETSEVRNGCDRAEISAEFDIGGLPELAEWLHENGFESEDDDRDVCLLRRTVDAGGRSRSFINGRSATLQQLHAVGEKLVDIQGQHAHQSLLRKEAQRELLDAYSGNRKLAQAVQKLIGIGRGFIGGACPGSKTRSFSIRSASNWSGKQAKSPH